MSAQTKMAQIVEYVSDKYPGIVLCRKWNRLLREMSKELEILEDAAQQPRVPDLLPSSACCASFVFDGTHHKDCRFAKTASR